LKSIQLQLKIEKKSVNFTLSTFWRVFRERYRERSRKIGRFLATEDPEGIRILRVLAKTADKLVRKQGILGKKTGHFEAIKTTVFKPGFP
jgi:hypothetical protein